MENSESNSNSIQPSASTELKDNEAFNEQVIEQQNRIIEEIASSQALIGPLINPATLLDEYSSNVDSPGFAQGLRHLSTRYLMRKIRGDGNCFYRALLFSYLEKLLTDYHSCETFEGTNVGFNNDTTKSLHERAQQEKQRIVARIKTTKEELIAIGYSEVAFEIFYDVSLVSNKYFAFIKSNC
jgi:hypothetical protein